MRLDKKQESRGIHHKGLREMTEKMEDLDESFTRLTALMTVHQRALTALARERDAIVIKALKEPGATGTSVALRFKLHKTRISQIVNRQEK